MNILAAVVGGWLGLNVAVFVGALVVAWRKRDEPIRYDVHEVLDAHRNEPD